MRSTAVVAAVVGLVVVAAGCSDAAGDPGASGTSPAVTSPAPAEPTTATSASSSPSAPKRQGAAARVPHLRVATLPELEQALAMPNGGIEVVEARVRRDNRAELDTRIRALVRS